MLKTKRHRLKQAATSKKKNKVGRFYKWSFLISLISFITLFYFMVLVSIAPKSFPYVTQKIQTYLKENVDKEAVIKDSHISFTRYGTFKISVEDLKIFYKSSKEEEKQELTIPKLEAEISLLNLLRFRITPNKIKIIDPEIVINNTKELDHAENEGDSNPIKSNSVEDYQINFISTIITAIKSKNVPIRNFEIENAKFLIKGKVIDTEIIVRKSKIKSRFIGGILNIYSVNRLSFDTSKPDIKFNSNCQLQDDDSLKCGLSLTNFEPKSIVNLHPKLKILEQLNSSLNVVLSFVVNKDGLNSLIFKTQSEKGSFDFPDFFAQEMDFSNLSLEGEYHKDLGVLTFSKINADFPSQIEANLQISATISNLQDPQNVKSDFEIKLQNVPNDEMEKFWPKSLRQSGIRSWVIKNIKGGVIKDAYAKLTLQKNILENIDSNITFSGINLTYSENFPAITNIEASANFTKKGMKISIISGDVLGSKISDAKVEIADFHSSIPMLNISGKSYGAASDSLKHAHNDADFASKIEEYLNGDSQNSFDIRIPLSNKINLEDTYIEVNSSISNLKNDYAEGAIIASTKKDFASNDFITSVNFKDAKLTYKALDITKEKSAEGALDLIISFSEPEKIWFKDINLWKEESVNNGQITDSKISGNIAFDMEQSQVSYVKLKNNNFGKNNYSIFYSLDKEKSSKKVIINGKLINLGSLIENKFSSGKSSGEKVLFSDYRISVKKLLLANNKSIRGLNVSLDCDNKLCHTGVVDGFYDSKDYISIKISRKSVNSAQVKGRITNVGYLSEALNISDKISSGKADIDLTNKIVDNNQITEGEVNIEDGITIFESAEVKRLSTDSLFSTVKDKIFSSEKIIFDSLKIELLLQDHILNLKSLIANNYKIGITAKGKIDLSENNFEIKGMIVPGFIINNLFGIGKIPILGGMVSGLLTGGEGGGIFGIGYEYKKNKDDKEAKFKTHKVSAFVPTTIRNLFDAI